MPTSPTPAETDAALDAAAACYLTLGVAKTTAADIARAAGISRATLYRWFGSHEAIFLAVLERESAAMAAACEEHLAGAGVRDPSERLLESVVFSIGQVASRPLHAAVFTGEQAAWADDQTFRAEALRRVGAAAIRPLLSQVTPAADALSDDQVADIVDWILRVLISFAAIPGPAGRRPADIRRQLSLFVVPGFERAIASR